MARAFALDVLDGVARWIAGMRGSLAGSYQRLWLAHRCWTVASCCAHSFYLIVAVLLVELQLVRHLLRVTLRLVGRLLLRCIQSLLSDHFHRVHHLVAASELVRL